MSDTIKRVIFASSLPLALGATAGRWGHQAVYVPSQQTMYVVGGQVVSSGSKVTNDVLVLPVCLPVLTSHSSFLLTAAAEHHRRDILGRPE